jgi:hypothetical protein
MATDNYDPADTSIRYAEDGHPLIPMNRDIAAARLRALDGDAEVVNQLLDISHPLHKDRTDERRALQLVVGGAPSGHPVFNPAGRAAIDGRNYDPAREEVFRRNVASKVDAIMPPRG